MATRVQREIASAEAAFGAAVADIAAALEAAGSLTAYDDARVLVEQLQRDGWRYRPREHAPSRPPMDAHIPASEHAGWQRWKDKIRAEIATAQQIHHAHEEGRPTPGHLAGTNRTEETP